MYRMNRLVWLAVAVALTMFVLGCSDDDNPPDSKPAHDAGVDALPDASSDMPTDGGAEAAVDTGPDGPAAPKYTGLLAALELEGHMTPGGPGPDAGPPSKMFAVMLEFAKPDPVIKPDFVDPPAPPNCTAHKWSSTTPKNASTGAAGKITVTGLAAVPYVDGMATPPTPQPLPAPIECLRKQVPGSTTLFAYDCGLPQLTILPAGSAIETTTKLTFDVAGGADITAFNVADVAPAPVVTLKASTDLYKLDPTDIKIEWDPLAAMLMIVQISAQLQDGSEFAEILCTDLALKGAKQIPAGALALLPTGTPTNPLILQTAVVGANIKGATETWGTVSAVAGKGVFGVSCWTGSAQCPTP